MDDYKTDRDHLLVKARFSFANLLKESSHQIFREGRLRQAPGLNI